MAAPSESPFAQWPGLMKTIDSEVESHDGREQVLLDYIYKHPQLDELRGSPQKILAAMDEFAAQEAFLINIGADKARVLGELIRQQKPRAFIEVGGYVGYSAILAGHELQQLHAADGAANAVRVWSLEMEPLFAAIAMSMIDLAGLNDIVKVVVGPAGDSLKRLVAQGSFVPQPDMLLLDHVEDLYVQEFKVCEALGLLHEGFLVVADNVVRPGAPEYRKFVRAHKGLDSRGVPALITPGNFEDEFEVSRVLPAA